MLVLLRVLLLLPKNIFLLSGVFAGVILTNPAFRSLCRAQSCRNYAELLWQAASAALVNVCSPLPEKLWVIDSNVFIYSTRALENGLTHHA